MRRTTGRCEPTVSILVCRRGRNAERANTDTDTGTYAQTHTRQSYFCMSTDRLSQEAITWDFTAVGGTNISANCSTGAERAAACKPTHDFYFSQKGALPLGVYSADGH